MASKQLELEKELAIWKAKFETLYEAYQFLAVGINTGKIGRPERTNKPFTLARLVEEESRAVNFVNNILLPELQKRVDENPPRPLMEGKSGEELVQVQSVWMAWLGRIIWNLVKDEALVIIAKSFEQLKENGAEWAKQGVVWVLNNLQQWLFEKYQQAHDEEERKYIKDKIVENYPESELAKKIQNS